VFLIGAAIDCDLVLGDAAFPEVYAYLLIQAGHVTIRRVGHEPELLVNGEPSENSELTAGDRLAFGPFELTLQVQTTTPVIPSPYVVHCNSNWPWIADLADI